MVLSGSQSSARFVAAAAHEKAIAGSISVECGARVTGHGPQAPFARHRCRLDSVGNMARVDVGCVSRG